MNKKIFILSFIALLSLTSCNNASSSSEDYGDLSKTFVNNLFKAQEGYKITANVKATKSYYSNSGYDIPTGEVTTVDYYVELVYQNNNDYIGVDRRYYEVGENGEKQYLFGENAFSFDGYVGFNYLDYNNTVKNDGIAYSDETGNYAPYASSGYVNPFTLVNPEDFSKTEDGKYDLNNLKSTIFFVNSFGILEEVVETITIDHCYIDEGFTKLDLKTNEYRSHETLPDTSFIYTKTVYEVSSTLTEVGTANAHSLMKQEEEKEENKELQVALNNFVNSTNMTIERHLIPYVEGELQEQEECITVYYDGESIYDQVWEYNLQEGVRPNEPTASDIYLKLNPLNQKMKVYVLGENGNFVPDNINFVSINNLFTYSEYLPGIVGYKDISANVFNKNEDGSYSPTLDNLPYLALDLFIPFLSTVTYINSGFTTSTKIYLTEDKTNVERIVVTYDYYYYSGTIIYDYSNFGTTTIPFEINIQ